MTTSRLYKINVKQICESLQSDICPACGGAKTVRHSVCTACWKKLPVSLCRSLSRALPKNADSIARGMSVEYRQTLIDVLTYLRVSLPVFPGDQRAHAMQEQGVNRAALTADVCKRAIAGRICPACSKTKVSGVLFCPVCTDRLRGRVDRLTEDLAAPGLFAERLETVEQVFALYRLRQAPELFADSFHRALHFLDCTRVYLQRDSREWSSVIDSFEGERI